MPKSKLNANNLPLEMDWEGNNIAITCPLCRKVFIVSQIIHKGKRKCPICEKSIGRVTGGKKSGGIAEIYMTT
ncbi:MAG: hypothetical protein Q7W05_13470 [Deltaproteobacteria bacterium]|nr:hypothetical protein [Deltaproteobacteria bacterium]